MTQAGWSVAVRGIIKRDLLASMRRQSDALTTVVFFIIVTSLFPLSIGGDPAMLRTIGPGIVWVAALLSCLVSVNRLFAMDYADGTLEQMVLTAHPLSLLVIGKVVAHWLTAGLPVVLLSPLLGLQFGLTGLSLLVLIVSLLLGTPTLSLIGSIGAALTLGIRGGGPLTALLILPLFVPVLIFGAGAVAGSETGIGVEANLSLLGAGLLLVLVLAPVATAAALRLAVE